MFVNIVSVMFKVVYCEEKGGILFQKGYQLPQLLTCYKSIEHRQDLQRSFRYE